MKKGKNNYDDEIYEDDDYDDYYEDEYDEYDDEEEEKPKKKPQTNNKPKEQKKEQKVNNANNNKNSQQANKTQNQNQNVNSKKINSLELANKESNKSSSLALSQSSSSSMTISTKGKEKEKEKELDTKKTIDYINSLESYPKIDYGENIPKEEKPTINLVIIGHVDSGKSTIIGHLLLLLGLISEKDFQKKLKFGQKTKDSIQKFPNKK